MQRAGRGNRGRGGLPRFGSGQQPVEILQEGPHVAHEDVPLGQGSGGRGAEQGGGGVVELDDGLRVADVVRGGCGGRW